MDSQSLEVHDTSTSTIVLISSHQLNAESRLCSGEAMALKVASLGSSKHHGLKHQKNCLMALRSLWGRCVPHILLAGELRAHGHGYGLGTQLVHGRHPKPGSSLLMMLQPVHGLCILSGLHDVKCYIVSIMMQVTQLCCRWLRRL